MEEIFAKRSGSGNPIVLIHGFCETHEIWDDVARNLAKAFEVIVIDLPGFGQSPPRTPSFSITDISERILYWIDQNQINKPFVVGHSLGGYIGLSIAKLGEDRLMGLGLLNSTPQPDSDERKSNRNRVIEFVKRNGVDPFIDTYVPGLFYDKSHPSMSMVYSIARKTSSETIFGYSAAMRDRPSSVEFLKEMKKPVIIIAGENDDIVSKETTLEFAALSRTNAVHILKNSGHMGMLEQPEVVAALINDFVTLCSTVL